LQGIKVETAVPHTSAYQRRVLGVLTRLFKNEDNGMETIEDLPYRISTKSIERDRKFYYGLCKPSLIVDQNV
jgi:hypothetical protein